MKKCKVFLEFMLRLIASLGFVFLGMYILKIPHDIGYISTCLGFTCLFIGTTEKLNPVLYLMNKNIRAADSYVESSSAHREAVLTNSIMSIDDK